MAVEQELTIDALARRAGMTVRNVRAHAARGLLPAPRMEGRTGYYGPTHLARLALIVELQEQGFSLAVIERLVDAVPRRSAEEALSAYLTMLAPWKQERPVDLDPDDLAGWLGIEPSPDTLVALREVGLLRPLDDGRVRITNPGLVRAGAEAVALGVPVESVLAVRPALVRHVESITAEFVELFRGSLWARYVDDGLHPDDEAPVRDAVAALQPIAAQAVMAAFREAMPAAMGEFIVEASDRLELDRRDH